MIDIITGPLTVRPQTWTLVFSREARTWWAGWLACGEFKHVRAYAYVPFLHVWVFYDVHLRGTDIIVEADGEPALAMIARWCRNAELVSIQTVSRETSKIPLLGFCVPAMKRLLGIRCSALRPTALLAHLLRNGCTQLSAAGDGPGVLAPARAEQDAGQ